MGIQRDIFRNSHLTKVIPVIGEFFSKFFQYLVRISRSFNVDDALSGIDTDDSIYALNSTTTDLCLLLFL